MCEYLPPRNFRCASHNVRGTIRGQVDFRFKIGTETQSSKYNLVQECYETGADLLVVGEKG